jgi:hypothetical protein
VGDHADAQGTGAVDERAGEHDASVDVDPLHPCLYAVYDPVSRVCSLASAGHVPPAVVTPLDSGGPQPSPPGGRLPGTVDRPASGSGRPPL